MDIIQLASQSGDSQLLDYTFSNGVLRLSILSPDVSDRVIAVNVPTHCVVADVPKSAAMPHRTCFIEILDVETHVKCDGNGIVIPSDNFGIMMRQVREGYYVVYGSRLADFPFLFRLVGARPLIVCPVARVGEIRCEINAQNEQHSTEVAG